MLFRSVDFGETAELQSGGVALSVSGEPFMEFKGGFGFGQYFTFKGIGFEYNSTGAAVNQQLVGGFNKTLQLPTGSQEHPFVSAIVTGLEVNIPGFASLSGDFAFQYRSNEDLAIVADHVSATFAVNEHVRGGVTGARMAMLLKKEGTVALQTAGGEASLHLGAGFAQVSLREMGFSYNKIGRAHV